MLKMNVNDQIRTQIELISKEVAKSKGVLRYFDGKPCRRGHLSERLVSNGVCCACKREDSVKETKKKSKLAELKRTESLKYLQKLYKDKEIVSRAEAIGKNLKFYFTGVPCSKGHVSERFTSNATCRQCTIDRQKYDEAYRESQRALKKRQLLSNQANENWLEKRRIRMRLYVQRKVKNDEKFKLRRRELNKLSKQKLRSTADGRLRSQEISRRHRENPKNKHKLLQRARDWYSKNSHVARAASVRYRASKLQATPKWLTEDHLLEIKHLYKLRKDLVAETGVMHHVDHVVPLKSDIVCGLHVPWNLQIIPARDNLSKNNTRWPDMP